MAERLGPEKAVSLFKGMPEEKNWALAPYLVEVDEETLGWIRETLWSGASWGILLESARTVEDLSRHFRRWVVVEDPNGDEMYFRFYDAEVLRTFLATATHAETLDLFGPVTPVLRRLRRGRGEGARRSGPSASPGASREGPAGEEDAGRVDAGVPRPEARPLPRPPRGHVEEKYPEKVDGRHGPDVRAEVTRLCHRSRRWGLTSEAHVTAFTDLSFEWGEGSRRIPGGRTSAPSFATARSSPTRSCAASGRS